jgi:hypothetical protein
MTRAKDEIGNQYGTLLVMARDGSKGPHGELKWVCLCLHDGNWCIVLGRDLRSGHTSSCGCFQRHCASVTNTTHGLTSHPLYDVWYQMHSRTTNPSHASYKWYGERGIRVCPPWMIIEEFIRWAQENGYRAGVEIHRVDNDRGYAPDNCIWVTKQEHMRIHHS